MTDAPRKLNIRYLGFENDPSGGRNLAFALTAPSQPVKQVVFDVPAAAFTGTNRITFQECAALCNEKLRHLVDDASYLIPLRIRLTEADIFQFRPRKRQAATAGAAERP